MGGGDMRHGGVASSSEGLSLLRRREASKMHRKFTGSLHISQP